MKIGYSSEAERPPIKTNGLEQTLGYAPWRVFHFSPKSEWGSRVCVQVTHLNVPKLVAAHCVK